MSDKEDAAPAAKKKGKLVKILGLVLGLGVLVGGGVGAGLYAASSGLVGGAHGAAKDDPNKPHLVPKSEQKRAGEGGGEGGHGGGEEAASSSHGGLPTPESMAGDKFASNYYPMEKEFTSNLQDSTHFVQVGVAISTPYDDKVIEHLKTNDIAIRSAILMTLGDTTEEQVFTSQGKQQLARKLTAAINGVLEQKEGFGGVSNVYFTNFVVQ
ncbi:flagellar basal body-associated FliL family protein [Sphingomonas sp. HHU CXW]|uniref:Flagellar protein FliL n=1 Tax=Sphingomonas hominis TaxID=2741495 RepID=A0ABX2JIC8_9SPHN|nr:flagellar basal body-associated FliL family protein [Sphingomonas hominis]NTS65220.1 flagellar basal body-associated FliL family protein [Sphingomonas hominis]